ncbi:MAG: V-type ATPase 116kDa subunit family protein [Actinomycetes bacterium]
MAWREALAPVRMQRVALVAPRAALRDLLVRVADAGTVELDLVPAGGDGTSQAQRLHRRQQRRAGESAVTPLLSPAPPDLEALDRDDRLDLLAGEAEVEEHADAAVVRGELAALAGWTPTDQVGPLTERLAEVGGGVVPLATPRGVDPPTLLRDGGELRRAFTPLVETYATVPYADIDITLLAGVGYVFMFGMMFGDAGHGALLLLAGLLIRFGGLRRLVRFRQVWPFAVGAGLAAIAFGVLYGEFFGPTSVLPVIWLDPLDQPVTLLATALGVGAVLLAGAYVVGTVNRWREGGWALALCAPSGIAGAALFLGLGLVVLGWDVGTGWVTGIGVLVGLVGLALAYVGLLAAAGGGGAGVTQATVELFDAVLRLGTNLVSFARLAAFGLTHAALGQVVWDGTTGLWGDGVAASCGAVVLFLVGNAIAFALEALVAGVQALRLEYYELFSRVFTTEGRAFRPWHVPLAPSPDDSAGVTPAAGTGPVLTTPERLP